MVDEEVKVEGAAPPPPNRSERSGRLGLILQVVNTVALVAILALQLLRPGGIRSGPRPEERHAASVSPGSAERAAEPARATEAHGGDGAPAGGAPGPTMRLPDFVVHLRDPDADRYARVSFEVELKDEKAKEGLTARLPQLRDTFLVYLSDRSSEDLRGGESIGRVKTALAQKLTEVARDVPVRALYITELVVQ